MDPSHSSALSSVSQNSHVVSLNALTEEIVAYEKEIDDTHAVKSRIHQGRHEVKMKDPNITNEGDVHDLEYVENEFPAIVFNDTLMSEPMVSSPNNEIDFRISFDESDDEDYTMIFDKKSFSYKIIYVDNLKTDSENDNDKVNMPSFPSPEPTVSCFDDLDYFKDFEKEFSAIVYNDALTSKLDFLTKPTVIRGKMGYDLDNFKDFEKEFSAIVYNDALTSKLDFLTEPTVSPQHIDEFNLKDETSLSECDEEEQNVLNFNDLFPFNVIYPNDSKSDKDNDDDKVDIGHSSGDLSVKPLLDVINTDVGAYAHGSNKLLETNYASSSWCLRELVKILECKKIENPKYEVRIIFYDVKPDVVRKQTDRYAEAFVKHQVSNRLEVDNWKEALSMAANLSGWDLQDMTNG
ncbi:putative reverse transcriptase domain-containing protein [Tanacetum coccineum]|uniref:ADP-ribosyl cyclase/cyclic ADP-ribose hydrolase n=1 Tax=Tanacetum coccineum TaxID=301880 RepID=A0ABQ5BK83_9ASTR